jgi:hypothetical protein
VLWPYTGKFFVVLQYHCWKCGEVFCTRCIDKHTPLPGHLSQRAVPVCRPCYRDIRHSGSIESPWEMNTVTRLSQPYIQSAVLAGKYTALIPPPHCYLFCYFTWHYKSGIFPWSLSVAFSYVLKKYCIRERYSVPLFHFTTELDTDAVLLSFKYWVIYADTFAFPIILITVWFVSIQR